jgi:uncharacterized protein YjeT (DUF2065 family)
MLTTLLWRDLGAALALVLVLEGLMPLVSPATAKRTAAAIALLEPGVLRIIGALSVGAGLTLLYAVRG